MIDLVRKASEESRTKVIRAKDIPLDSINKSINKKLSKIDKDILRTIKNNVECTNRQIVDALCLYSDYACVYLTRLRLAGLIKRTRIPGIKNVRYTYKLSNKMVAML